jgi:hypothetical protein
MWRENWTCCSRSRGRIDVFESVIIFNNCFDSRQLGGACPSFCTPPFRGASSPPLVTAVDLAQARVGLLAPKFPIDPMGAGARHVVGRIAGISN